MTAGWSDAEVRVLMEAYVELLQAELDGNRLSKAERNRRVQTAAGRSKASIEFKFCNLSAVMVLLGYPFVEGYKPRINFQRSMLGLAEDFMQDKGLPRQDPQDRPSTDDLKLRLETPSWEESPSMSAASSQHSTSGLEGTRWPNLRRLWDVATGGTRVAAAPDQPLDLLATGPAAPGTTEALSWFRNRVLDPDGQQSMLFLVGGPGAGKSHTATTLIHGLQSLTPQSGLAQRRYDYSTGHSTLTVVNDATIPPDGQSPTSISVDIDAALLEGRHLFSCVNRGMLVQDQQFISASDSDTPGAKLVEWLTNKGAPQESSSDIVRSTTTSDGRADVLVVYLDICSLFEPASRVVVEETEDTPDVRVDPLRMTTLSERAALDPEDVPGLQLTRKVMEALTPDLQDLRPDGVLHANLTNLSEPSIQASLVTMLRCSELQASQYFTYRELWGALSRSVLGSLPREGDAERAREWDMGSDDPDNPQRAWEELKAQASYRWPQALFDASASVGRSGRDPVARLTIPADPARDALPGTYDPRNPNAGWATYVLDAFASQEETLSPLEALLGQLPAGNAFQQMVQPFDHRVDEAYKRLVNDSKYVRSDKNRASLGAWYGGYLTRLFAAAHGITAFLPSVALWLEAWNLHELPHELKARLRSLLRPRYNPDDGSSPSLLPLFDTKARPITGRSSMPRLALPLENVDLKCFFEGNAIKVQVVEQAHPVVTIDLDFSMVREAMACSPKGHEGLTELTPSVSPRLERIRSAHLMPENLNKATSISVIHEESQYQIGFKK